MKPQTIINTLIIAAGLVLLASCCAGCNSTKFTKTAAGDVTISNQRWCWQTDSYTCNWTSNSASLEVNKSGADAKAVVDIINATATAAGNALK